MSREHRHFLPSQWMPQIETERHRSHLPVISLNSEWLVRHRVLLSPMMVLNTIVADQLKKMTAELEGVEDFDTAVKRVNQKDTDRA